MTMTWTPESSALDASYALGGCWSPELDLFVAVGDAASGRSIVRSTDGTTWLQATSGPTNQVGVVEWSPALGIFVAVGAVSGGISLWTSPDGNTWTSHGNPFGTIGSNRALRWSASQALFVLGGFYVPSGIETIWTSPDGITWTARANGLGGGVDDIAYSPTLNLWVAVGNDGSSSAFVATSPDAITWTLRTSPFTNTAFGVVWSAALGVFIAGANGAPQIATSIDGTTWTARTSPFTGGYAGHGIATSDVVVMSGDSGAGVTIASSSDAITWTSEGTVPTLDGGANDVVYSPELDLIVALGFPLAGDDVIATASPPSPPVVINRRFFQGYPWRFLFADIPTGPGAAAPSTGGVTTTWANGLLTDRAIAFLLDAPSVISAAVWPDDRRVNEIFGDGDPLVAQSNRVIYAFRRDWANGVPWTIRAAGILMSPEDQADADIPLTHIVAPDAWQYLYGRPVVIPDTDFPGEWILPPAEGCLPLAVTGDQVALEALRGTIEYEGFCFIDAGVAYGGTAFYEGTIEETLPINYEYQRGAMVGQVWADLCNAGNMDIVLTPIYDPLNRPGYTHELNIFKLAGDDQRDAVFGWDKMTRSATTIDRNHDGTPGNFINKVQYFAGQGGFPVPSDGPLTNPASVAKYLPYWSTAFQTTQGGTDVTGGAVLAMAQQQLQMAKQGLRTLTLAPTPERSPIPLIDYNIGDRVPIYTSKRLRVASAGLQRVQGIPIQITDDGIEQVPALLCSSDYRPAGEL